MVLEPVDAGELQPAPRVWTLHPRVCLELILPVVHQGERNVSEGLVLGFWPPLFLPFCLVAGWTSWVKAERGLARHCLSTTDHRHPHLRWIMQHWKSDLLSTAILPGTTLAGPRGPTASNAERIRHLCGASRQSVRPDGPHSEHVVRLPWSPALGRSSLVREEGPALLWFCSRGKSK